MTRPVDPDELLTLARQEFARARRQLEGGDAGPALGALQRAADLFDGLDAYLIMGGRLPSQWKRAKPAAALSATDRSTAARCGATLRTTTASPPNVCDRLRGHDGPHKHLASGFSWR